ncbi:nuclear transport factor 2 family protein [Novosphingobium sp. CECT 9465]|uniref:nuclear transport factor 2 family protein n=1 Tax=Novosphingobium sp. CECT 9465 TaxID=2829794 RepID=UPI001E586108|nr:nuclear transport factor 2 family protein [Novosphingobium sp. CECT 9465]CAH0498073.1 Bile acid 7-alpha dehydratase [Novosphingobium sp. CECT 9465]
MGAVQPVDLESVCAVLAIHTLKARYFRAIDTRDWALLRTLFTPDATLHFTEAQNAPLGLEASISFIASGMEGSTSVHHGHMPEIEIISPKAARGIWAMEDRLWWQPGSASRLGLATLQGCGHYYETYAHHDDGWRISSLRLVRQWVNAVPATEINDNGTQHRETTQ